MKELREMKQNIDYKKTKLDERKSVVLDTLNTEFLEYYFDEHYQPNINKNGQLAEENEVCKMLDQMANYLLSSDEIKEQSKREKQEYKFYSDPLAFKKALSKETNLEKLLDSDNKESENVLHILKQGEKNLKTVKNVQFNKKDLERDDELSRVLDDYNNFSEQITKEIKNPDSKIDRFKLTRIKGSLKDDMNTAKEQILGVFGDHMNPQESTKYDISLFDLSNKEHLLGMKFIDSNGKSHIAKGLLFLKPTNDLTNDFNLLLIELQEYVKKANLTDLEREIASLIVENISKTEIAEKLQITSSTLRAAIKRIAKKVVCLIK